MTTDAWDPAQYNRFADEREQPFWDLTALLQPVTNPVLADLGCGDGRLTAALHAHLAAGTSHGVDSSAAMINDARAFGLAELRLGAGRGARAMIGFTLGTGVGGVIAIDGHIYQGRDGTGGEMGHQTLDPEGPTCGCGNRGCLEAYARADRIAEACGTKSVEEAIERARAGDPRARAGLERVGRYLGVGIANMITTITPQRVVLGGGVAASADLLLDTIRDEVRRHVFTTSLEGVEIVTAELGTWAGAIGAAIHGAEGAEAAGAGARQGRTPAVPA